MNNILLKFAFLALAAMLLSAAPAQHTRQGQVAHAGNVFLVTRVYFPALPFGDPNQNIQTYIQGLKADTADFQVWPILACISMPQKTYQSKSTFFVPGKQFSAEVSVQVVGKDKNPITYKGALLLEVIKVYPNFTAFMAEFPGLRPKEGMNVMSLLLNFTPDASLQNFAATNKQNLMPATFGPNFADGWPVEMKEGAIKFIRQILLEKVE